MENATPYYVRCPENLIRDHIYHSEQRAHVQVKMEKNCRRNNRKRPKMEKVSSTKNTIFIIRKLLVLEQDVTAYF